MNQYALKQKESSQSLNSRIDAHKKHADKDITDWILQLVRPQPNESILDVGCGNGNQALKYARCGAQVVGVDISDELLKEATNQAFKEQLENAFFYKWDMNKSPTNGYKNFDKISSCFSIYYADDINMTLSHLKKMLKPFGKLFIIAPTELNAMNFMQMHWTINHLDVDEMAIKRTSRAKDEVIPILKELFKYVDVHAFKNKLVFDDVYEFMEYYCATPLFMGSVKDTTKLEAEYKSNVERYIGRQIKARGEYSIYKESYGIIAGD